ncbi:unnamed protein product [Onchocerca flexuosa]|uniref:ILEI domain-containing protein n=1 Tax=Onchocerca flexuosa TaxID=387005 RepID=A0A183I4H9_9BILA|nr:unnamed protein product [Onchocerca flexuosa]
MRNAYCPKDEVTVLLRPESRTKPPLLCLNNKKISAETRQLLRLFGLSLTQYKSESSVLFIGQLGLLVPEAFEKVVAAKALLLFYYFIQYGVVSLEIAEPKYYIRCLKTPMGKLSNITIRIPEAHHIDEFVVAQLSAVKGQKMKVNLGAELPNCGHTENCPEDEIPMFFYSGKDKDDSPQLCVNGRLIIDRNLNSAGRGLNLVVIDSKTHQVMRTGHYDTYLEDSSALVLFLEQLSPGEILAVISFDEASNSLSEMAKHIFYELGSSLIYRLKFRASWYFIGQKGIDGYTPFEDMNLPSGNDWAKPIRQTICVPSVLDGLKTAKNDLLKTQNMLRRHFCSRYDGYEDFCDGLFTLCCFFFFAPYELYNNFV